MMYISSSYPGLMHHIYIYIADDHKRRSTFLCKKSDFSMKKTNDPLSSNQLHCKDRRLKSRSHRWGLVLSIRHWKYIYKDKYNSNLTKELMQVGFSLIWLWGLFVVFFYKDHDDDDRWSRDFRLPN
jgi:hypothetical protein